MELQDLIGEHELSGFDNITINGIFEQRYDVVRFIIDGKTYMLIEDPSDGYRSFFKELEITNEKITNTFTPQKVIGKMKYFIDNDESNVIQFVDAVTDKVVLELGTARSEDWYPFCIMEWSPQNLAINISR